MKDFSMFISNVHISSHLFLKPPTNYGLQQRIQYRVTLDNIFINTCLKSCSSNTSYICTLSVVRLLMKDLLKIP